MFIEIRQREWHTRRLASWQT